MTSMRARAFSPEMIGNNQLHFQIFLIKKNVDLRIDGYVCAFHTEIVQNSKIKSSRSVSFAPVAFKECAMKGNCQNLIDVSGSLESKSNYLYN